MNSRSPAAGTAVATADVREESRPSRRALADLALALLLAAGVFAGHYALALKFSSLQAFGQFDVLFDADPSLRLEGFSHGWGAANRSLLHPNLANFINPPLRLVARALQLAGFGGSDVLALREALALMVTPLISALQAMAVLVLFLRLGYRRSAAVLLSLFGAVSFSQIVFGSVPEHFALSGLFLTIAFILAADLLQRQGEVNRPAWLFVGWLIAGITISNIALLALIFWVSLRFCRRPSALRQTAFLVLTVAAITYASYLLLNLGYDADPQPPAKVVTWTAGFVRDAPVHNLRRFPTSVADALAPPEPVAISLRFHFPRSGKFWFQFTLADTPAIFTRGNLLGSALFLLLAAGALGHYRKGGHFRGLAVAAAAMLAFNALLHAVWGHEYFLYSQHWLIAAVFLAAGIFHFRTRFGRAVPILLAVLTATVALNNFLNVQLVLQTLAHAP